MEESKRIMLELQKYIVLLLRSKNNTPIRCNAWFQKQLFLIAKNIKEIGEEASFDSDVHGPYSENAKEQLEDLETAGVLSKKGNKRWLSDLGMKIGDDLIKEVPKKHLEMIDEFKDLLNDLNEQELLTLIHYTFPEYTEESLVKDKIEKNRLSNALSLYKKEKISIGKTSEVSGVPLEDLVKIIKKRNC